MTTDGAIAVQVNRLAAAFPMPRWSREERTEYARCLHGLDLRAIDGAVSMAISTWLKDTHPPAGRVREAAVMLARAQTDGQTARKQMLPPP